MLDQRSFQLFEEITKHEQITKNEVIMKLNVTERQFNYDLEKVNDTLRSLELPPIKADYQLLLIDEKLRKLSKSDIPFEINLNDFIISEENRVFLIYLYTFSRQEPISNYHYQSLLRVSKNTALGDVKKLKKFLKEWKVELVYSRNNGYHLEGTEIDKRRFASYCINSVISQPLGKETIITAIRAWEQESKLLKVKEIIDDIQEGYSIKLVKSRKTEIIFHLVFIMIRNKSKGLYFNELEKQLVRRQCLFNPGSKVAQQLFTNGGENESYYVTIQLLIAQEEVDSNDNPSLENLAGQIIDEFEKNTLLPIENKKQLKQSLYNHLVPAFFRITFEIPLVNLFTERIKTEYQDLFQFVKRSLSPLTMWTGKQISESEIGFFTLHFGGYLERGKKKESENLKAILVCSNGVSTSIMLRAQLKEIFPEINFSRVHTARQIKDIPLNRYDLVFSTMPVDAEKPVFIVKPLLDSVEKNYLIQEVSSEFPKLKRRNISINQVMTIINKHADIKEEKKLFSELVDLFYIQDTERGNYKPMLSELLTKDMIHFTNEKFEWKDAITKAAQPLIDTNKVKQQYVDAMINKVEEIGTYIHIGKGIAIPHARPENGVNQIGMSLLRTKTPVYLLDQEEHKIDIFICLAAIDNEAHLKALAHLTRLLGDNTKLQALKDAETAEQIIDIIKKGEEQE